MTSALSGGRFKAVIRVIVGILCMLPCIAVIAAIVYFLFALMGPHYFLIFCLVVLAFCIVGSGISLCCAWLLQP